MVKPIWRGWIWVLMVWLSASASAATGWETYKSRFITPEGRVIDTGNKNISHTEGQGFAMLMAAQYGDRAVFDSLWNWTRANLRNNVSGLFYWRYDPAAVTPVADKNNASDGDVLIAWALLKAGTAWQNAEYLQASDSIQKAILAGDVVQFAGRTVMLPGAYGFNKNSYVILNPSYFLFPAWRDFANRSHLQVWRQLIDDGLSLVGDMRFGSVGLPTDWVALNADGSMAPATAWPSRFSYDAIRIPLYLYWYDAKTTALVPFQLYWRNYARLSTPAWIDVLNNNVAPYAMQGGLLAVRDLTMGNAAGIEGELGPSEDYYSSSLHLLALLAKNSR
ncbi:glycosyl hydrolase family 8 [Dickeya lacustris]|uniref:Glucanase n=1 Tax=Dickeya lacustris TaxID=2259638 RepID=A0ABY8G2S8_9GAMM|nr:glycosyl hydrolase family 8 [Dickeya lacustris]WFN54261.1 glycosyl hydrolase family 8 [Dickeya lacustris]